MRKIIKYFVVILLLADVGRDRGGRLDTDIADTLGVNVTTVERVRKRCVMAGLDAALNRKPHPKPRPRLLNGEGEDTLTMLACSQPLAGQASWTLALLGDRLVELNVVDAISKETVRRTLKKLHQTVVAADLVPSAQSQCRFRRCNGGCAVGIPTGFCRRHGFCRYGGDLEATNEGNSNAARRAFWTAGNR